jgi:hypothetical protein
VNFDESLLIQRLSEESDNTSFDSIDRLIGDGSQVDDSIVELSVLFGNRSFIALK